MPNVVCCGCSAVNRLAPDRPMRAAKCGRCAAHLFVGAACAVTGHQLDIQIARSEIPVLVDVWAPWCGPCRMMSPAFEAAAPELEPGFRLLKLNSDEEAHASARLGIRGIPTMILFREGREAARVSGAMSTGSIVSWARSGSRAGSGADGKQ